MAFVDQGYTGDEPAEVAQVEGLRLEVIKLPEAKKGFVLLPRRWVVERSFAWVARFRRLAQDYERLAQQGSGGHDYYLNDALGSMRQMVNASGTITQTQSYKPYGEVLSSQGSGVSIYGYTGEQQDNYTMSVNLRSRQYSPDTGRFISKDIWQGNYNSPLSLNKGKPLAGLVPNKRLLRPRNWI